jgi:hypothetical protein
LLPELWRSSLPLKTKIQGVFHLLGYSIPVLLLITSLMYPFLLLIPFPENVRTALYWIGLALTPVMLGPLLLLVTSQRLLRPRRWRAQLPGILVLSFFSMGLVLNTTRAFWRGLRAQPGAFERTPKVGSSGLSARARQLYARPRRDRIVLAELGLAGFNAISAVLALHMLNTGIFLNAMIFAIGLFTMSMITIRETRAAPSVRSRKQIPVRQPESQAESALPVVSTFDRTR